MDYIMLDAIPDWPDHIVKKAREAVFLSGYAQAPNAEKYIMEGKGDHWSVFQVACIAAATEQELDMYMPNRKKNTNPSMKKKIQRTVYKEVTRSIIERSRTIINETE